MTEPREGIEPRGAGPEPFEGRGESLLPSQEDWARALRKHYRVAGPASAQALPTELEPALQRWRQTYRSGAGPTAEQARRFLDAARRPPARRLARLRPSTRWWPALVAAAAAALLILGRTWMLAPRPDAERDSSVAVERGPGRPWDAPAARVGPGRSEALRESALGSVPRAPAPVLSAEASAANTVRFAPSAFGPGEVINRDDGIEFRRNGMRIVLVESPSTTESTRPTLR